MNNHHLLRREMRHKVTFILYVKLGREKIVQPREHAPYSGNVRLDFGSFLHFQVQKAEKWLINNDKP